MPSFIRRQHVPYKKEEMFNLVANVGSYPEFLPMCQKLIIRSRKEKNGKVILKTDMTVGYRLISEKFTTNVHLQPKRFWINVEYVDGPFRYLKNHWLFLSTNFSKGCDIEFFIDYEFKNSFLKIMFGAFFERTYKELTNAFEKRADSLYCRNIKK